MNQTKLNEVLEDARSLSSEEIERVNALSTACGAGGMEDEVVITARNCALDHELGVLETDSIKNLWIRPEASGKPVILLDAHSDEVACMVQSIHENGTLAFLPLGSMEPANLTAQPVTIQCRSGQKYKAICSALASHSLSDDKSTDWSHLFIDVGTTSRQETEDLGIRPGDFIIPDVTCIYDEKREIWIGKAFDCRIGCAALLETMIQAKKLDLDVDLLGILTTQEETGGRGAESAANRLSAKACIVFEGCPADDIFVKESQTAMKKGPMIRLMDRTMITHPKFMAFADQIARKYDIPLQQAVRKGGGTNGDLYYKHNIPAIVIGIPVRYAHSCVCYTSMQDYKDAVRLALAILAELNDEILDSFFEV